MRQIVSLCVYVLVTTNGSTATAGPAIREYPNDVLFIDPAEVPAAIERGAVVIDARPAASYRIAHVSTAIHLGVELSSESPAIPLEQLRSAIAPLQLAPSAEVIVYDEEGVAKGSSPQLLWMFEHLGFTRVRVLRGGIQAWTRSGKRVTDKVAERKPADSKPEPNPKVRAEISPLAKRLREPGLVIVDVRPDEKYNGWKLDGEARGGHIAGAISIPLELLFDRQGELLGAGVLGALFEAHGITREKEVVACCGARGATLYFALRLMGHPRAACMDQSMKVWSEDRSLPMEHLPGFAELVYPAWIADLIAGKTPPEYANNDFVLAEVSWGGPESVYDKGHIPGAIHVNTDEIESDEKHTPRNFWNLVPDAELITAIEKIGITRDTTVVIYSDRVPAAARFAWALLYAGVRDVRILNGGFEAWRRFGGAVTQRRTERRAPRPFGAKTPAHPEYRDTIDEVRSRLDDKSFVLGDVRSWAEFTGLSSGYTYIRAKGRIPGSRYAHGGPDKESMLEYHDADGTLRSYPEIAQMWRDQGIVPEQSVSFYCGTGWRASVAFLYARWMGFPKTSVFDSGWLIWTEGPGAAGNPTVLGPSREAPPRSKSVR